MLITNPAYCSQVMEDSQLDQQVALVSHAVPLYTHNDNNNKNQTQYNCSRHGNARFSTTQLPRLSYKT